MVFFIKSTGLKLKNEIKMKSCTMLFKNNGNKNSYFTKYIYVVAFPER